MEEEKRGREDMTARGLGAGLGETPHTKCLIRAKSRSVCARRAKVSSSNGRVRVRA